RPLANARPDVPPGLAIAVDRLRARDPAERPANADEVIAMLEPFALADAVDDPSHWSGPRWAALVMEVLHGRTTPDDVCRRRGLPIGRIPPRRAAREFAGRSNLPPAPPGCRAPSAPRSRTDSATRSDTRPVPAAR